MKNSSAYVCYLVPRRKWENAEFSMPFRMSTLLSMRTLPGLKPKRGGRQRFMTKLQKHNPSNRMPLSPLFADFHWSPMKTWIWPLQGGPLIRKFHALTVDSLPPVDVTKILKNLQRSRTKTTPLSRPSLSEGRILMVAIYGNFTAARLPPCNCYPSERQRDTWVMRSLGLGTGWWYICLSNSTRSRHNSFFFHFVFS